MYNNSNSGNNYGNQGNYRPYNGNRGYGAPQQNRPVKKHSGAKAGINKKGKHAGAQHVSFWNYSRSRGLVSGVATVYSGTHEVKSKAGRVWQNWMVSWKNNKTMQTGTTSALYDPQSGKVIINAWGWVLNPRTNYAGKFTRSK